ncbi:MarR family winged helix-turn-helix transcriptional regulator [Labrys okinawensis]|uniref:MarR family winged helix-turn-helix transcriptional regulator n=1 Tax=Labrys okinawensis TaxID=346911 RepID=UPI0039BCF1A8
MTHVLEAPADDSNEEGKEMLTVKKPVGIDQCNCFTLRKASRRITRFYDDHLQSAGLKITQFLTIAALNELGSTTINLLAERLDVERTAMGKMVGFLERDGVVTIKPSPVDARSRVVELTPQGQGLFDEALPLWLGAQRDFEQLNGAARVASLRHELAEIKVGEAGTATSDE